MRNYVDLDEIMDYLTRAVMYDGYLTALCPFHDDSSPSFFVNEVYYNCPSCGANGSTSKLLDRIGNGVSFSSGEKEAYTPNPFTKWMKQLGSLEAIVDRAVGLRHSFPYMVDSMTKRGITPETIVANNIGWMDGFITFPVYDAYSQLVSVVARTVQKRVDGARYFIPVGSDRNTLYVPDWSRIRANDVFLVFGIVDALTLYQMGYPVITKITGISADPEPFKSVFRNIHVIPDYGEEKTASELVAKLGWRGKLFIINFPDGVKDINEFYLKDKAGIEETFSRKQKIFRNKLEQEISAW